MLSRPAREVRRSRPINWVTSRLLPSSLTLPELMCGKQIEIEDALGIFRGFVFDAHASRTAHAAIRRRSGRP